MDSKSEEKSRLRSRMSGLATGLKLTDRAPRLFSDLSLQTGVYYAAAISQHTSNEVNEATLQQRTDSNIARDYSSGIGSEATVLTAQPSRSRKSGSFEDILRNQNALLLEKINLLFEKMSNLERHVTERLDKMEVKVSAIDRQTNNRFDQLEAKLSDVRQITTAAIASGNNRIVQNVNKLESSENNVASITSVITTSEFGSESKMQAASSQSQVTLSSDSGSYNNQASIHSQLYSKSSGTEELFSPISEKYQATFPFSEVDSQDNTSTQPSIKVHS